MKRRLPAATINAISSHYLQEGRKQESWAIQWVDIDGDHLYAQLAMTSMYQPPGGGEFHLTIFSTLEFASQLMIIYVHDWAGLNEKVREGWMVRSTTRTVRAIRDPRDIRVEMHARTMRKREGRVHCVAEFTVTDGGGGLFEVTMTGFLA